MKTINVLQKNPASNGIAWKKILQTREFPILLLLVAMCSIMMLMTSKFATVPNITVLFQGMTMDMMVAIPMAISLIAGNVDFSVGSIVGLSSALAGMAMNNGAGAAGGIAVGLMSGAVLGLANALIINKFHVTPLVATLGTWYAYRGLSLVIAGSGSFTNYPEGFLQLGRANLGGVPIAIVYMVIIIVGGVLCLKYVNFFHNAYYIGSNRHSAKLAGIDTKKFTYITYVISGLIAAFAGLVLSARLGSSSQNTGQGLEFRDIVALLVGGISMDGGEGTLWGAVLGVIIMQLVNNALVLLYVDTSFTQVIIGGILIIAVAIDQLGKRRKARVS